MLCALLSDFLQLVRWLRKHGPEGISKRHLSTYIMLEHVQNRKEMAKVHDFLRIRDLNCSKETTFSLKLKFSAFWGPFRDTNLQFAMYIYLFTVYIYITHIYIHIHTHSLLVHSWFTEGFHHFLPSEKLRNVIIVIVIPEKIGQAPLGPINIVKMTLEEIPIYRFYSHSHPD